MIVRKLLFSALRMAANNPKIRRQAAKAADKAVEAARPSLLQASRRAGEAVRSVSDELTEGVKKFKAGVSGDEAGTIDSAPPRDKGRPPKNITPPEK